MPCNIRIEGDCMNILYKELNKDNYNEIINLWNENIGCNFPMDKALFCGNLSMDTYFDKINIIGAYDEHKLIGFVIYKEKNYLSTTGIKMGNINSIIVDFKYRNHGIGSQLLEQAEKELDEKGVSKIHAGRDTFHFFPGVPLEALKALNFFKKHGFADEGSTYDLICNLKYLDINEAINAKGLKLNNDERYEITLCTKEYEAKTFEFLNETFPGRWHDDLKIMLDAGMELRDLVIIIDKDKNKVIGFCHIFDKKSKVIGPSVYWRGALGDDFGGLGPIGVSREYRKLGLGLTLLVRSVEIIKSRGVRNMCIDWTELFDFYGALNFIPWKGYMHMSKAK